MHLGSASQDGPADQMAVATAGMLGRFVAGLSWNSVPESTRGVIGRNVADVLGCALAGAATPVATAVRDSARSLTGLAAPQPPCRGWAHVLGTGEMLPPAAAALANATAAHALELDDTDARSFVHAGAVVIPAVLAVAEAEKMTGRDAALAILAGYEVTLRLARWLNPAHREVGFHTTATVPTLGVAAAVTKLLGGGPDEIACAVGVSTSFTGGTFAFLAEGANIKRVHAGKAAFSGILSAMLARDGVEGPVGSLDGPYGLSATMASRDLPRLTISDPTAYLIEQVGHKPYPCCRFCHASIDAAIQLCRRGFADDRIDAVEIVVSEMCLEQTGNRRPINELQRQFSTPYGVALGLLHGKVALRDYRVGDPAASRLAARCCITATLEIPRTSRRAEVTVRWDDGMSRTARINLPSGEPEVPLDQGRLLQKFVDLTQPTLGPSARAAYESLRSIATQGDLAGLLGTLRPRR